MNTPIRLNALCSLTMLLLFAAASFAQGDEKIVAALAEEGIAVSRSFRSDGTVNRSATARVKFDSRSISDGSTTRPAVQDLVALDGWKQNTGELRSQRSLELSKYLILCVSVDESGNAVWLSSVVDPRTIRAEVPDESGMFTGRTAENREAEILLTIPAIRTIREVKFFESDWDGGSYKLVQIGSLRIAAEERLGQ